jgi:hypothetical protein
MTKLTRLPLLDDLTVTFEVYRCRLIPVCSLHVTRNLRHNECLIKPFSGEIIDVFIAITNGPHSEHQAFVIKTCIEGHIDRVFHIICFVVDGFIVLKMNVAEIHEFSFIGTDGEDPKGRSFSHPKEGIAVEDAPIVICYSPEPVVAEGVILRGERYSLWERERVLLKPPGEKMTIGRKGFS